MLLDCLVWLGRRLRPTLVQHGRPTAATGRVQGGYPILA
jgi:hypothetical protein